MNKNSPKLKKTILGISVPVLVVLIIVFLISFMYRSLDKSVYYERRELLTRLSDSCASVLNYDIEGVQKVEEMLVDAVTYDLPDYDSVNEYIDSVGKRENYISYPFFLVDSYGKYYSSDGVTGKITDTSYYTDTSDENLLYISSLPHFESSDSYLIIRERFKNPIHTKTNGADTVIEYCGILYDVKGFDETISNQFSTENNCFIYDENGQMLYKKFGITLLIEGYNIYSKLHKAEAKYGEDGDELEEKCRNGESIAYDMIIDGDEYYFTSSPIKYSNLSIAFVVEEKHISELSGSDFTSVMGAAGLIALLLFFAMAALSTISGETRKMNTEIRHQEEVNKALEEASRAKSDFLSNMSHDIRTPINGIMGMTTIAKNVPGNPKKTQECLEKIDGASGHLLSLINDVLDMSRIERGKTQISAESLDIKALCDNCASIVKGHMSGRDLELSLDMKLNHTRIIGDALHLRQIFINILGNAVKFTPDGGRISFRADEVNSSDDSTVIRFEIEDTGIGMSPEFLPTIFESFSQENGGNRTNYKGTGLGMAITKQLVDLMGGTIEVESELNKGSKFTVTVTFLIDDSAAEEEEENIVADISGVKILLVEDNELNMDIATELLSDEGAEIMPAENGEEALRTFSNSPAGTFDIILMDIMMPVMNGLEAARAIRALDREDAKKIPILAMTANAFEDDIKATREAGMNAHLSKPINVDEVINTIAKFRK